jgi:hypothetical protein
VTLLLRHPGVRLLRGELRLWTDLVLLCRGRSVFPPGAVPLPATQGLWFLPGALTAVTAVEITAVELLVSSALVRVVVTVISVYSLLLLWSVFGRRKVYPPFVSDRALVIRQGRTTLADIPRESISAITADRNYRTDRAITDDGTLVLGNGNGTNLEIRLTEGVDAADPDRWPRQKPVTAEITEVLLWVDDPAAAVAALGRSDA